MEIVFRDITFLALTISSLSSFRKHREADVLAKTVHLQCSSMLLSFNEQFCFSFRKKKRKTKGSPSCSIENNIVENNNNNSNNNVL